VFLDTLKRTAVSNGGQGGVIDFHLGFRCLTSDTVMDYCFQQDLNAIAAPAFKDPTVSAMIEGFDMAIAASYFPNFFNPLVRLLLMLPEHVRETQFAPLYGFETMSRLARERVMWLKANPGKSKMPTLFDGMFNPDEKKGQVTPPMKDLVAVSWGPDVQDRVALDENGWPKDCSVVPLFSAVQRTSIYLPCFHFDTDIFGRRRAVS
jgi:hypothetical protein